MRTRLPDERKSVNHRFILHGVDEEGIARDWKGYITVGFYPDGKVGEVFVKMDRQGGTVSGFIDAWAIAMSMLLQEGVPLADLVKKYKGSKFPPSGRSDTKDNEGRFMTATSPIDYVVRWLEMRYGG